jgi:hypothetical protein
MPLLWQPGVSTDLSASPAAYTLVTIATQDIDVGVILRFQMWDGLNYTWSAPVGTMATFDLVVQQAIPASTQVTVSIRPSGTCLFAFGGIAQYSNVGAGVSASYMHTNASMLCFAYVPTASGSWLPASGQPQFAIGFSYQPDQQGGCPLSPPPLSPASATAPNFPDQFSGVTNPWVFDYEIVYPSAIRNAAGDTCFRIYGIKFKSETFYATGSWSNLRQVIAQPLTVIQNSYETINNWEPYSTRTDVTLPPGNTTLAVMGPFEYAVAEGQLAVVYFRPLPGAYPVMGTAQAQPPAEVAFVLTAPIPGNVSVPVTIDGYDSTYLGYGPRSAGGSAFIDVLPSFYWNTSAALAAGTVILISNIGSITPPTVQDAHNSAANVGGITDWDSTLTSPVPVVSLIFLGAWQFGVPQRFITAALSSQYVGDFPQLSPSLTILPAPFTYPAIYGQGKVFTNLGLPGTVQSAMVNSGAFVTLPWVGALDPTTLPTFLNMGTFSF